MRYLNLLLIFLIGFFNLPSWAAVEYWQARLPEKSTFYPSEDLEDRVEFWVKIYSHYTTKQGVFHLVDDPSLILAEIDLTSIVDNKVLKESERRKLINEAVAKQRQLVQQKWKISDIKKIRLQMGLKDRMQKAFFHAGRYLPMMEDIFKKENLPIELTRLVFVESSFNIRAQSKVGASGLWQIMPGTARPHGYLKKNYDKRNHPIYATRLAAKILSSNYKQLKLWPLAITAYNHGAAGVQRMVNLNRTTSIEELIETNETTASWGFASKNFYACFLAVLEVERNAEDLFGKNLLTSQYKKQKEFYLAKKTPKKKVLSWFDGSLTRFQQLNPHLNWNALVKNKYFPAGIPLIVSAENYQRAAAYRSKSQN